MSRPARHYGSTALRQNASGEAPRLNAATRVRARGGLHAHGAPDVPARGPASPRPCHGRRADPPRRALARRHSRHEKYCARRRRFTFRKHPGRRAVRCRACDDKRANIFWRLRNKKACKRLPTCIITPRSTTRIARARQTTHISDSHPARTPSACAQPPRAQLRARALGGIAARGIRVIGGGLGDLAPRTLDPRAKPPRSAPSPDAPLPRLHWPSSTRLSFPCSHRPHRHAASVSRAAAGKPGGMPVVSPVALYHRGRHGRRGARRPCRGR